MATKLKHLKITKVDFVDEGANPDAHIMLFKRKPEEPSPVFNPEIKIEDKDTRSFLKRLADAFRATFESFEPSGEEQVDKSATSFMEEYKLRNLDKIVDDMWNVCYALNNSLCSILCDEELDGAQKLTAMTESLDEFTVTTKEAIKSWAAGDSIGVVAKTDSDGEMSKRLVNALTVTRDRLSEIIEKSAAVSEGDPTANNNPKGEQSDMKFDKSKMTPAEKAMLEQFEKNYGVAEDSAAGNEPAPQNPEGVTKGSEPAPVTTPQAAPATPAAPVEDPAAPAPSNDGDIYKGLNPVVKAELESLKKFKEDAEDAALHAVAKSYALIGKTDEELFPVLKSLKQTNQTAYDQMIAALDSAKAVVEKSGVFGEIGRSGNGATQQGGAVKEVETKAGELMKSKNGLTFAQAIDAVLQADPELAKRYETED